MTKTTQPISSAPLGQKAADKPSDNIMAAMVLGFFTGLLLACMNLMAKLLGDVFIAVEITFARNVVAFAFLIAGCVVMRRFDLFKTKRPAAQFIRAAIGTTSLFFTIWSYTLLPLADATVLLFTQPLWVVLMSYPILGEKVGPLRIAAVLIGFTGVFIIANPSGEMDIFGLSVGLMAGFLNGLVALCLRWLGRTESASTTVFYFVFLGLIGTGLILLFFPNSNFSSANISDNFWPMIGLGVFGLGSLITKTHSYRLGPASVVTPVGYTMILWAGLFDYFLWNRLPTTTLIIGGAVIISSNIFILWREHVKKSVLVIGAEPPAEGVS